MALIKTRKGILLTLATIVLVVLILAELVTYVYLNINYENITSFGSLSNSGYRFASALNSSIDVFIHSSLTNALKTLQVYEARGASNSIQINNTVYALQSLITNGTIYGTNEITLMGGQTLNNYTNSIERQALFQNLNLTITNATISIYQKNPSSINITYRALALINSSSGSFLYPITATTGIPLNGTTDLYTIPNGNNYNLKLSSNYPTAVVVGNVYATAASTSPFQSVYGIVLVENGIGATCGTIANSLYETPDFILAVSNAASLGSTCGFGGIVTYNLGGIAPKVPYLVYNSATNVINNLQNGTSLLLDGQGRSLINVSSLQSSIYSGSYFNSTFAPSYLDWAQGNITKRSQNGLFSFNIYRREVPSFVNPNGNTFITTNAEYIGTIPVNHLTLSIWFNLNAPLSTSTVTSTLESEVFGANEISRLAFIGSNFVFGETTGACSLLVAQNLGNTIYPNTWHNVVAVANNTIGYIYIDDSLLAQNSWTTCSNPSNANTLIGRGIIDPSTFNGFLSNFQIYNKSLSQQQIGDLYYEGIEGAPVTNNLIAFWPLNGNLNDYSGNGKNGAVGTNVLLYNFLIGYSGDPVYGGSFYSGNATNLVYGPLNCGNINKCSNAAMPDLYLGGGSLSTASNSAISEAGSFGLQNAIVPNIGFLNGNGYAYGHLSLGSYYGNNNRFSVSSWIYLTSNTNGPVADISGCLPDTCATTPIITVSRNTIYAWVGSSSMSYIAPYLNNWYNAVLTYNSVTSVENLYVNGVSVNSLTQSYTTNPGATQYWATACAVSCTLPGGIANTLTGRIGDVQFYSTDLANYQVLQLYQNNTVVALNPTDSWSLSSGFNGLLNQTINIANTLNPGVFANMNGLCSNANAITNTCGVWITQP